MPFYIRNLSIQEFGVLTGLWIQCFMAARDHFALQSEEWCGSLFWEAREHQMIDRHVNVNIIDRNGDIHI